MLPTQGKVSFAVALRSASVTERIPFLLPHISALKCREKGPFFKSCQSMFYLSGLFHSMTFGY